MRRTGYVFAERYLLHDPGTWHPERPDRLKAIHNALKDADLLELMVRLRPDDAPLEWCGAPPYPRLHQELQSGLREGPADLYGAGLRHL